MLNKHPTRSPDDLIHPLDLLMVQVQVRAGDEPPRRLALLTASGKWLSVDQIPADKMRVSRNINMFKKHPSERIRDHLPGIAKGIAKFFLFAQEKQRNKLCRSLALAFDLVEASYGPQLEAETLVLSIAILDRPEDFVE